MKPAFASLLQHYPPTVTLDRDKLLVFIGWADVLKNPAFRDTCAIRMSIALGGAGVALPGARMRVNAGPRKGLRIEPGQAKLSRILRSRWGEPEVYRAPESFAEKIGERKGVVSFFRIRGGLTEGGHIDLYKPGLQSATNCAMSCYFSAAEAWFWELS